jgi:hypothetical protein
MAHRDLLAPRADGTMARIRVFDDVLPHLAIDTDRAFAASRALGGYNPSYHWATRFYTSLASAILIAGFVALFWWPWWVPIIGIVLSRTLFKSAKLSCGDFVHDIVRDRATGREEMARLGLVLESVPSNAIPEL